MTDPNQHVFFDPSGRRRRVINRATLLAGIATGVMAGGFVISLLLAPFVTPPGSAGAPAPLTPGQPGTPHPPPPAPRSPVVIPAPRPAPAPEIHARHDR